MIMELSITDGPRTIETLPDSPALLRRGTTEQDQSAGLWFVTLSMEIRAPVSWWKQAQHYFQEILWVRSRPEDDPEGRQLQQNDFEQPVPEAVLDHLNQMVASGDRTALHSSLPDSFVRRGVTHTNLAVLRDIITQRGHYDQGHWAVFCRFLRNEQRLELLFSTSGTPNGTGSEEEDV
ncbi:MAG: hypothetical protein EA427_02625 [Spirochaetaceae bacterium]|nr:MAG: hypothetical protein EA427_02625 [Spirochaetaceae bacterium]